MEDTHRVENEVLHRLPARTVVRRELPVERNPSPERVGLQDVERTRKPECAPEPTGAERFYVDDLPGSAIERGGRVENESLHHPLRRARDDEMDRL